MVVVGLGVDFLVETVFGFDDEVFLVEELLFFEELEDFSFDDGFGERKIPVLLPKS